MASNEQTLKYLHVLLVEDEPDIADLLLWILNDAGAAVELASSAEEALRLLKHYQPDILVCNVRLPNEDGDWLIRQIRAGQSQQHLPAIAVTSYDREVPQCSMLQAGFHHFMQKPLDPDELVAEILHLTKGNALSSSGS